MNEIIIKPNKTAKRFWKELWDYRELFLFLAWRDFLVRYKQTAIGVAWSVLRPVLTMMVFTVVFSRIAKLPSGSNAPYSVMIYSALLPWQFFSNTLNFGSNSLIISKNLVSKIYFPRIIIPSTTLIVSFIDFLISFIILLCLMIWFHFLPTWKIIVLPLLLLLAAILSLGITFFVSALNVKYRDFRYIIPFIIQFGLYISPVGFNSNVVPEKWRLLYSLNPMVGVIDGFRWALLGSDVQIYLPGFIISICLTIFLFIFGARFFLRFEDEFADII